MLFLIILLNYIILILREEKDLKVALELAEQLSKKKLARGTENNASSTNNRPGILKKQQHHPESTQR